MILENRKLVDAPQSIVWQVTEDIERWPQWTPTMKSVKRLDDGPLDVGSSARIKQSGLPEVVWRVTALTRGESFNWEARIRGIHMVATHELVPSGDGTVSILRVEMSGITVILLWPLIRISVGIALERENAGLKVECETIAGSTVG